MKKALLPLLCLLLLTSCGKPTAGSVSPVPTLTPTHPAATDFPPPAVEDRWWEGVRVDTLPDQLCSAADAVGGEGQFFLLAQLPQEDIALYGRGGLRDGGCTGVLLRRGTVLTHFEQQYLPADAPLLPELWWDDFDGNGKKELAVSYLVTNRSPNHVSELHLYQPVDTGWTDHIYRPEDYATALTQAVSYRYDSSLRTVTAAIDSTSASLVLENGASEPEGAAPLTFLNRTFYRLEGRTLIGVYGLGIRLQDSDSPQYFGMATAEVVFDGSTFVLKDITIDPYWGV